MNENIDLTKILKDCPIGWKLYTPLLGEVEFKGICSDKKYHIVVSYNGGESQSEFTKEGFYYALKDAECLLFPSAEQRDWSKFIAPWYKKERFDPKTLKPLDTVLAKDSFSGYWRIGIFSHYIENDAYSFKCVGNNYRFCIPYNDDTKHLVGTKDEPSEFYRYWDE